MDLVVVGVRKRLDIFVPIILVVAYVMTKSRDEGFVVPFYLAICLRVVRCCRLTLYAEDVADG